MRSRNAIVMSFVTVFVLVSSYVIVDTDVSDAASSSDFKKYYYNQLMENEKKIYEKLRAITPNDIVCWHSPTQKCYCYYVKCEVIGTYMNDDAAFASVKCAWEALKLTDPFAWVTWGFDYATACIHPGGGEKYMFKIDIYPGYINDCSDLADVKKRIGNMVQKSKEALGKLIEDLKLSTDSSKVDNVKAINNYICNSSIVYDDKATYRSCIYGALVAVNSGHHAIVCAGYSALVQALCNSLDIPCLTVCGLSVSPSSSGYHVWNVVMIDSGSDCHAYGYDATFDATGTNSTAYLLVGSQTLNDNVTFAMSHQAFNFSDWNQALNFSDQFEREKCRPYTFCSHAIEASGYDWPKETSILEVVQNYAPWVVVGVICALLAYVLWSIGKKGEINGR